MRYKRDMGTGSIEWRDTKSGRRGRVKIFHAGKHITLGTVATKEEGDDLIAAALEQLADVRTEPAGSLTLRDWGRRWFDARAKNGEVKSTADDESRWRTHVERAAFIDDPIRCITRPMVREWIVMLINSKATRPGRNGNNAETGRPLGRSTVKRAVTTLGVCLRDAHNAGLIDANPAADHKVPSARHSKEVWTYLTPDEIDAVLGCEKLTDAERRLYAFAIFTGLRHGELCGLRWGDAYLDHATPHLMVRRSYKDAPKNGKHGMTPLLERARVALAALRDAATDTSPGALVLPTADGDMRTKHDDFGWRRRGHKDAAGIKRRVRFHDLRHTCASHLLMGTWGRAWRIEEVSSFLRHSSIAVTQRYAHLAAGHLHAAASATFLPSPRLVPIRPHEGSGGSSEVPVFAEPSSGFEPETYGLRNRGKRNDRAALVRQGDGEGTVDLAIAYLRAVHAGEESREIGTRLAVAVIGDAVGDAAESEVG